MDTNEKVVLVTNSQDYAGPPAVLSLLEAGFRVLAHDRSFVNDDSWQRFRSVAPGAERIVGDTANAIIDTAWQIHGRIDALVSNDHYPAVHKAPTEVAPDDLLATLQNLVVFPFDLIRTAVPRFDAQGTGNIVMITSCRTRLPMYGGAVPDAARAAANALVRSLAIDLASKHIAVNAVAPNFLYSEAYYPRSLFIDNPIGRQYVESEVPVGRLGQWGELGELIVFLASTQARFLTGSIIDFAGAWPVAKARPDSTSVRS